MLVLSRKEDESIIINDNIEIKIIDLRSDQVKVGIIAPKEVKIYRREVYEEIQQANITASQTEVPVHTLKDLLQQRRKPSE